VVYVTAVTCHLQELSPFLREIERVLRPGGYLVGGEWFKASDNAAFVQWDNMLCERGLNFYFVSREYFEESLADCGFIDISILDRTRATTDNARDCLNRVENELHDQLLQSMDEQEYSAFKAWAQSRLIGLADGGMHYGHFTSRKKQTPLKS
jgi:SAM-dependent methyltransferase